MVHGAVVAVHNVAVVHDVGDALGITGHIQHREAASQVLAVKYVNVRRLFIFLEESIKANTNWVVFEPNDELLWIRVRRNSITPRSSGSGGRSQIPRASPGPRR